MTKLKTDASLLQSCVSDSFCWETEYCHHDNAFTMNDYLENHLPDGFDIILEDGSYAEVKEISTDKIFCLDAKGNGDSFHHVVNWSFLR